MSLTFRILLGFVVVAILGNYLLLGPIMDRVERQYLEAAEEPMVDAAEILAAWISHELEVNGALPAALSSAFAQAGGRQLRARIYDFLKTRVTLGAYVTDAQGVVLFDSTRPENVGQSFLHRPDVFLTLNGEYGARSSRELANDERTSVMYVGAPIFVNGRIAGVLSVSKPQRSLFGFIHETTRRLQWLALVLTLLFLLVGFLFSRWITQPLERITRHAEAISRGERPPPPRLPGRHLQVLGQSLEDMRDALEDRKYVESYVQTLSHEMKSPVAAIRGAAELLEEDLPPEQQKRFLGNIRRETERLQRLIEQLLALASLEKRKRLENPAEVDFSRLVARVTERVREQFPEVRLAARLAEPAGVRGEEFLLEMAAANLLQNAAEFSPPGGTVEIELRRAGDRLELRIQDEGPGIPDYAKEKVFSRFFSLPRPRTGAKSSGLGLCFVQEAVSLHGGSVSLENRSGGSGAQARLVLPAA